MNTIVKFYEAVDDSLLKFANGYSVSIKSVIHTNAPAVTEKQEKLLTIQPSVNCMRKQEQ